MIKIWYEYRGQRPSKTDIIIEDANKSSALSPSFAVVGVEYGRRVDEETVKSKQFALRVDTPSDNISTDTVDAIATAFQDKWGGTIEHVETVQL